MLLAIHQLQISKSSYFCDCLLMQLTLSNELCFFLLTITVNFQQNHILEFTCALFIFILNILSGPRSPERTELQESPFFQEQLRRPCDLDEATQGENPPCHKVTQ